MNKNKEGLLKEIGDWFGTYTKSNGEHIIDNGDKVFRYKSADEGLKDWVETLKAADEDTKDGSWSKAIMFIEKNCA